MTSNGTIIPAATAPAIWGEGEKGRVGRGGWEKGRVGRGREGREGEGGREGERRGGWGEGGSGEGVSDDVIIRLLQLIQFQVTRPHNPT